MSQFLGKFSVGNQVRIPIIFQSTNGPADVEKVKISIENYNKVTNKLERVLEETDMQKVSCGNYFYDYIIPAKSVNGTYIAKITAKQIGAISSLLEGFTTFEVTGSIDNIPQQVIKINEESKFNAPNPYQRIEIVDTVVDVYNEPIQGVHISAYEKKGFEAKSPMNVKVGSAMTDSKGEWKMLIQPGEYIFEYKGIGCRLLREIRKIS
jgi:hypothetical protein